MTPVSDILALLPAYEQAHARAEQLNLDLLAEAPKLSLFLRVWLVALVRKPSLSSDAALVVSDALRAFASETAWHDGAAEAQSLRAAADLMAELAPALSALHP